MSGGRPDEVERLADSSSERSVDEGCLTQGDEMGLRGKRSELLGRLPVKRQRGERAATIQTVTAKDEQMLSPLERNLEATGVQSTGPGRRLAVLLQEHFGETEERERPWSREREDTSPTASMTPGCV